MAGRVTNRCALFLSYDGVKCYLLVQVNELCNDQHAGAPILHVTYFAAGFCQSELTVCMLNALAVAAGVLQFQRPANDDAPANMDMGAGSPLLMASTNLHHDQVWRVQHLPV